MELGVRMLSLTLLLFGVESISNWETCPGSEDLHPCICAENGYTGGIVMKCFPYKEKVSLEKLRKILTNLKGKKNVEMLLHWCPWSDSNVTIPSDLFSGIDIKRLNFEDCKIHGLSNNNQPPLLGLENHLETLQLTRSLITKSAPIVLNFGHLQNLKELYIFKNQIKELGNDWLNGPVSLKRLSLMGNGVENVGDRAFANLVNVRELYFHDNPLPSLQRSMFPNPATMLKSLGLENTGLTTLPEDIFSNMPALRSVDLFINDIMTLDQRTWQPVWKQLDDVSLIANPIKCDDSMKWIFRIGKSPEVSGECHDVRGNEMDTSISEYIKSNSKE